MQRIKKSLPVSTVLIPFLFVLATCLTGCEVVEGIFKVGMAVGIIIVVIIIAIVIAIFRMFKRR